MAGQKAAKPAGGQLQLTAFFTPQPAGKRKFSSGIGSSTSERPKKKGKVKENVVAPLSPESSPQRPQKHADPGNKEQAPRELPDGPEENENATALQTKSSDDYKATHSRVSSLADSRLPLSPRSARRGNLALTAAARRLPAAALPTPPPTHQFVPKRTLPPLSIDISDDDEPDSTPTPLPNKAPIHLPTPRTPRRSTKGKERAVPSSPIDLCSPELSSPLTSLPSSPATTSAQRVPTKAAEPPRHEVVPSSQTQVLDWNPFFDDTPKPKSGELVFKEPLLPASRAPLLALGSVTSPRSSRRGTMPPPPMATTPTTSPSSRSAVIPTSQMTEEEELSITGTSLSPMRRRREQLDSFKFTFSHDDIVGTSQSEERELVMPSPGTAALDLPRPEHGTPTHRFGDFFPHTPSKGPRTPSKPRTPASASRSRGGPFNTPKLQRVTFGDLPRTPQRRPPRVDASPAAASPHVNLSSSQTVPESPQWRAASPPQRPSSAHSLSSVTEPESPQHRVPTQLPSHSQQRRMKGLPEPEEKYVPSPVEESQTQPESSQHRVPTQFPSHSQQRRMKGLPQPEQQPVPFFDESQTQPESSQHRVPTQLPSHSQQRRMKGLPQPEEPEESQTQPESSQHRIPTQLPSRSQQLRMKGIPEPEEEVIPETESQTQPESSQWRIPTQAPSQSQQHTTRGLPDEGYVPPHELGSLPVADEESQYDFDFGLPESQERHDSPSLDEDYEEEQSYHIRITKKKAGIAIRWIREESGGDPSKVTGTPPSVHSDFEEAGEVGSDSQISLGGLTSSMRAALDSDE